jgi:O-antigen/teichoic acid export membrane protein
MSESLANPSLKARILRGGSWVLGGQLFSALIRLGGNLFLTRLLVPEAFGLMSIVYVLMNGFQLFSDIGLGPNVVQSKRGEDPDFLNTAWVIQVLRGTLIWAVAALLSIGLYLIGQMQWLPVNSVYAHPLLPWVIFAYSATQFISGFYPTRLLVAGRRLSLARVTQLDILQQVIGLVIMVSWALLDPSIWALVGGTLITAVIRLTLYHFLLPGQANHWHWDKHAFKEIFGFGKWIFLSSIIGFLVLSVDRLILGGLVDAHQLGIYSIAYLMVSFPMFLAGRLAGTVAFPALSEVVREKPDRLKEVYYRLRLYFDIGMLFVGGVLFTFGAALIQLLYDGRYSGAGHILEILALTLIEGRYVLSDQCYLALGKPNLLSRLLIVRLLLFLVLLPAGFWMYQFEGAIWAIALVPLLNIPLILYFKIRLRIFDLKKELLVLPVFIFGMASGEVLLYFVKWLSTFQGLIRSIF